MNGRLYDPIVGRFLSPDNYVQSPGFTQSFNRYSYAWNNPLRYTDPDGEIIVPALVGFLLFTDTGYDIQKYISPVAVKFDVGIGYHTGIGVKASVGVPQAFSVNARLHGGLGYYWKNGEVPAGWQYTYGYEVGTSVLVLGTTYYCSVCKPEFNQQTGHARIGVPGVNAKYENDWFFDMPIGDGGDRYRTTGVKLQVGPLSAGINLFTGDPGLVDREIDRTQGGKGGLYIRNPRTGADPDRYRAGIGYIGLGPIRYGNDKENVLTP